MQSVYMIRNSIGKLYIGITQDVEGRVRRHNRGCGAKFTKYIPDFRIVFLEQYETLAAARQREVQLKKWGRAKKEVLIDRFSRGLETRM